MPWHLATVANYRIFENFTVCGVSIPAYRLSNFTSFALRCFFFFCFVRHKNFWSRSCDMHRVIWYFHPWEVHRQGALDTAQRGSHWSPVPGLASWCNRLWTASSRAMCTATWWALGWTHPHPWCVRPKFIVRPAKGVYNWLRHAAGFLHKPRNKNASKQNNSWYFRKVILNLPKRSLNTSY